MEPDFWHQRWAERNIAFHQSEANPMLSRLFGRMELDTGARIFVPLCGKTLDIAWLLSRGYRVAGAELSGTAVGELFEELGVEPDVSSHGELQRYSGPDIDIFVGDVFALTGELLGPVDAIYDRAALVALPEEMRNRYCVHISEITGSAPQFLLCIEYVSPTPQEPPFSIEEQEVVRLYTGLYSIGFLADRELPEGMKGVRPAFESAWLLRSG